VIRIKTQRLYNEVAKDIVGDSNPKKTNVYYPNTCFGNSWKIINGYAASSLGNMVEAIKRKKATVEHATEEFSSHHLRNEESGFPYSEMTRSKKNNTPEDGSKVGVNNVATLEYYRVWKLLRPIKGAGT
jgi:hypothetical protein